VLFELGDFNSFNSLEQLDAFADLAAELADRAASWTHASRRLHQAAADGFRAHDQAGRHDRIGDEAAVQFGPVRTKRSAQKPP
jgi:hypothetical protein